RRGRARRSLERLSLGDPFLWRNPYFCGAAFAALYPSPPWCWPGGGRRPDAVGARNWGETMYPNTNPAAVVGVFDNYGQAEEAIRELKRAGFRDDEIGILSRTTVASETGIVNDPTHSRWEEGAGIGAAAGAITGTGLVLAVAAGLIPGVGS